MHQSTGMAVTGLVDPVKLVRKSGAMPGDILFLSKPLGTSGGLLIAVPQKKADKMQAALLDAGCLEEILGNAEFPVAGQAHHPLIACSMLAAYANSNEAVNKEQIIHAGMKRADSIPGGFCAGFGADAAAISLGPKH
ncbi:MAG: DUF5714 domain-containing protein [Bacillota bacterium]|nr:DUF5714 domain-containing protein [Bacillota bacterium]